MRWLGAILARWFRHWVRLLKGSRTQVQSARPLAEGRRRGPQALNPNWHSWTFPKSERSLQVYVVEPRASDPPRHAEIFWAAINHLLYPSAERIDPYRPTEPPPAVGSFDLVTFPEAFLPKPTLIEFLTTAAQEVDFGCVHIGLRPAADSVSHMFAISELEEFIAELRGVPGVVAADIQPFDDWVLSKRHEERRVNLACLLAKDAEGFIRVCLHPKVVPSRWEAGTRDEEQMLEGGLVSLATLRPTANALGSITIQPLTCSDVLSLDRDNSTPGPIDVLTMGAELLPTPPPDYIDVVTVAVHSPQIKRGARGFWQPAFADSFIRCAKDPDRRRHRNALFVLANFRFVSLDRDPEQAGLSGIFIPAPPAPRPYPDFMAVYRYGKEEQVNEWSVVDPNSSGPGSDNQGRAHLGGLPFSTRH
jgi:hypothetical protein